MRRINPIAKAIAMNRRRTSTQTIPNKKKYNRKKAKEVAIATFAKDINKER